MHGRYAENLRKGKTNMYPNPGYEQPAAMSTAYGDQNAGYTGADTAGQDPQYQNWQDPGGQQQYDEPEYAEESNEPSLSDYNSHESCVRITTKK
jgi:hypothetical protein